MGFKMADETPLESPMPKRDAADGCRDQGLDLVRIYVGHNVDYFFRFFLLTIPVDIDRTV